MYLLHTCLLATAARYTTFNFEHFKHSLQAVHAMIQQYHSHPAVIAFQAVNEPNNHTPPNAYQLYTWTAYNMVQSADTNLGLVVHDSFRGDSYASREWLVGCQNVVSDIHLYTAWDWNNGDLTEDHFITSACSQGPMLAASQQRIPHVVGEYSLATDSCAMFLNGFNDAPGGYPVVQCDWIDCPLPYMGTEQPGTPLNNSLGKEFPISITGSSTPMYGKCPVDKSWPNDDDMMTK
eukprot:9400-Heterococcus_DN1.PRE.1